LEFLSGEPRPYHGNAIAILIVQARVRYAPVKCFAAVELMRIAHGDGISRQRVAVNQVPRLWINALGRIMICSDEFLSRKVSKILAGRVLRYDARHARVDYGGAQPRRISVKFNHVFPSVCRLNQDALLFRYKAREAIRIIVCLLASTRISTGDQ